MAPPALPKGGLCVITGGAGGLGAVFARMLARVHQAKLVLCGRSEASPAVEAVIQEVASLGGQAIYVSADISTRAGVVALRLIKRGCRSR